MVNILLKLKYALLQSTVSEAQELLNTKEVTIIGLLLFIISILIGAVIYLYKKNEKQTESRIEEQKEFTKEIIEVTKKASDTVNQLNEILKITTKSNG